MIAKETVLLELIHWLNNEWEIPIHLDGTSRLTDDVGLDSLDLADIYVYIRGKYGVKIEDADKSILKQDLDTISTYISSRT